MKIEEIALTNFRSYRETQRISGLTNVNTFIGPNGAGKSNVIEALKFLKGLQAGNWMKPFYELVFDRNRDHDIEISLQIALSDSERDKILQSLFKENSRITLDDLRTTPFLKNITYTITIGERFLKNEIIKTPNIKTEEFTILRRKVEHPEGNSSELSVDLDGVCQKLETIEDLAGFPQDLGGGIRPSTIQILNFSRLSPSVSNLVSSLRNFVQGWDWFDPNRRANATMESGEESEINSSGDNLTKFLNSYSGNNPKQFTSLTDDLKDILSNIEEVTAPLKQRLATLKVKEKGLETPTELSNISYGYMQILILVFRILTKKSSLFAIEEPELHLHASAQRRLLELIRKNAKEKQFFLTTHSTIFAGCDGMMSTYLITKPDGATRVARIDDSKNLRLAKEELGHRNIDLFGYECVVFIEGDSEDTAFPVIAKSLGFDLCAKGIYLTNVRGKDNFLKIEDYLGYMKDSGVITYVIADGNKKVKQHLEDWQRAGIIMPNNCTVWELEFEDCFSFSILAGAINELFRENKLESHITVQELEEGKQEGVSIVKTLETILPQKGLELRKTELAEKIAQVLDKKIKEKGHNETYPEAVIKKIVELVDKKYPEKTD